MAVGQKRKFTLLDANKSIWKVTWRLLSFHCKLFYIFTHFSFPLFFFFWWNYLFTGAKWLANLSVRVIVQLDFKLSEQLPQKAPVDMCIQTPGTGPQWGVNGVQGRQWRQREGSVHECRRSRDRRTIINCFRSKFNCQSKVFPDCDGVFFF